MMSPRWPRDRRSPPEGERRGSWRAGVRRRRRGWELFLSAIITLALLEMGLSVLGFHSPRLPPGEDAVRLADSLSHDPHLDARPDSELGWVRPANWIESTWITPDSLQVDRHTWSDGTRRTRAQENQPGKQVLLLGGSLIEGYGLNDDETLGWLLQADHPDLDVRNGGVSGYGTCQSFLELRRWLKHVRVDKVLYGFIEPHEERNVLAPTWAWKLAVYSSLGNAYSPYCRVTTSGALAVIPARLHYPEWPLQSKLNIVAAAQFAVDAIARWDELAAKRAVTYRVLDSMQRLVKSVGASFDVAFLEAADETVAEYEEFLAGRQIRYVDCRHPMRGEKGFVVEGDPSRHPNKIVNEYWAGCIERGGVLVDEGS